MTMPALQISSYLFIYFVRKALYYIRHVFAQDNDDKDVRYEDNDDNENACSVNFLLFVYLFCHYNFHRSKTETLHLLIQ